MTHAGAERLRDRYHEYVARRGDELGLFYEVARFAALERALYPGSYIHVTPSLVFTDVVYVDTDPKAKRFFRELDDVQALVMQLRGKQQPVRIGSTASTMPMSRSRLRASIC